MENLRATFIGDPLCNLKFSNRSPDNGAVVSGKIILVESVMENEKIQGHVLMFNLPLYEVPYSPGVLKIGYYNLTRELVCGVPTNKYLLLPHDSLVSFVVVPYCC